MSEATCPQTEEEYEAVMAQIDRLWGAPKGTPVGNLLDRLIDLAVAYEEIHHAI